MRRQSKLQQREIQTGMMELLRRNLGHEIRNLLGGIRGAAQMMAAEMGLSSRRHTQMEGDGTVVYEAHFHICAKATAGDIPKFITC